MKGCPNCGGKMSPAEADLYRTTSNIFAFGFGSSELRVRPKHEDNWQTIMVPSSLMQAWYCKGCGSLLLKPHDWQGDGELDEE